MQQRWLMACFLAAWLALSGPATAQDSDDDPMASGTFAGLEFRGIGPALMSGRIAHIEFHPTDPNTWYIAVGSGGVWKTVNAGTTWTPIFDDQPVYSIGTIAIDPQNPNIVWVGTGEDVGGRHVGFGDGIYRSDDGGKSWKNMGLKESEHIARIRIHPEDSDVILVAAQGPLWSPGGERGFYRSDDGGETWEKTLGDDEYTGVTDIVVHPNNPDVVYAATWQHHRTVAAYMGGGPKSGVHRSDDNGKTWTELENGIPDGNLGKIGLAVTDLEPDTVYAAIELDRREGGVFRSVDRGASWEKQSDTVSGGTGPHYYQELYASPHHPGRLYLMNNTTAISYDFGKTFVPMSNEHKHGDDHAIAFRPDDPDYLMLGSDGGLYETFDHTTTWRYLSNLPVTQFYKVAVDDDAPFYNIYGGTQDNNSQGGPSRTDNIHGIRNSDWFITLFGDGHQSATEPGNPDIVYAEWQQGNLVRYDRTVGEVVYIKPQPEPGDAPERFNWDAPILVSPHKATRLYFASQRVWRSEDRGDTWTAISDDLTRDEDRMVLPIMGRQQSWDAPWDMLAMSQYNTITSLAESPVEEGVLYVGTDDGLIQSSRDGGQTWRSTEVGGLPGVPDTAFVNDIKADLFDADTVYVALDNHKYGDFKPYLLKSTDGGRRWSSIASDLPDDHLVWRVVQDHVNADLMFAGTEFGVFFTVDGGGQWVKMSGTPTISFRDLAIQRRENDLVGASFGRGFFVLDDYSALREISPELLAGPGALFAPRKAWWYKERMPMGLGEKAAQGHGFYAAPNPAFGATFTYYLGSDLKTREAQRQEAEAPLAEAGDDTPFPGWDAVVAEQKEDDPQVILTIRDANGEVVRRLVDGATKRGFHRMTWDLRAPAPQAIGVQGSYISPNVRGHLLAPGAYSASLAKRVDGTTTELGDPVSFEVERMTRGTLHTASAEEVVAFWERIATLERQSSAMGQAMPMIEKRLEHLAEALSRTQSAPGALDEALSALRSDLFDIKRRAQGTPEAEKVGQLEDPGFGGRLSVAQIGTMFSTYGPTPTHERNLSLAEAEFEDLRKAFVVLTETRLPAFEKQLSEAGAPWVPGMPLSIVE